MNKLSIITSHFNRKKIFYKCLKSFMLSENINNCEFVIVDDCSDPDNDISNIKNDFPTLDIKFIQIEKKDKNWLLPTVPFNIAFNNARYDKFLMINPECFSIGDVIKDALETLKENTYQVYGCYSLNKVNTYRILNRIIDKTSVDEIKRMLPLTTETYLSKDGANAWYQHSVYRPLNYCFCLAMYKSDYRNIGCLNDVYADGKGYGDDDLVLAAIQNGLHVVQKDDPFVLHLNHYNDESYLGTKPAERNAEIFNRRKAGETIKSNNYENIYKKYLC